MKQIHFDEAREGAVEALRHLLHQDAGIERAVVVDDLRGRIRVVLWPFPKTEEAPLRGAVQAALVDRCAQFWTGDLWLAGTPATQDQQLIHDTAWEQGVPVPDTGERLRLNDRHRNRTAWFLPIEQSQPVWPLSGGPPIVVFYSFKGGVGRTTALAAYAIARARRGERLAIIDFDLDAPGVGRLLDDGEGHIARWGVVDFLLEHGGRLPLDDYRHTCAREQVTGPGIIDVFPAGRVDDAYLTKLARIDLEVGSGPLHHPLASLLRRVREELRPTVILIDGRAGLSPAAGLLLSGLAHLHVLLATTSAQSFAGLERVVHRLGYGAAQQGTPQAECVVVQAMVPEATEVSAAAQADFGGQVEAIFRKEYYAADADEEDRLWSLDDLASSVAPHAPVAIPYRASLAFFQQIDQVVELLATDPGYQQLTARIDERLAPARQRTAEKDSSASREG